MRRALPLLLLAVATLGSPVRAQGPGPAPLRRKVLFVGVDGCRPDALLAATTPNIDALAAAGIANWGAQAGSITISGPGWSTLLSGVWWQKHGVVDNSFAGARFDLYPPVTQRIRQACPGAVLASIVDWAPVNDEILTDVDFGRQGIPDTQVATEAAQLLTDGDPDFLYLHFDNVDEAGHAHGFSPAVPEYIAAIEGVDTNLGTVLAALRSRPTIATEDWLIVVATDYGGQGTSHGADIPECRTVFIILSGNSAQSGVSTDPWVQADVTPTILDFLGIAIDPAWNLDGQPIGLSTTPPPGALRCPTCPRGLVARADSAADRVSLTWSPAIGTDATSLEVRRNGAVIASLPPDAAGYVDDGAGLPSGRHLALAYEVALVGGSDGVTCRALGDDVTLATGTTCLSEDFDDFAGDPDAEAAGWRFVDVASPLEASTWTITNPGSRNNPPRRDGRPSRGRFLISDSDHGGSAANQNPTGSGMSHDLWSPALTCPGTGPVVLHASLGVQLNDNGKAVFDVDVSTDGERSWIPVLERVAPSRTEAPPFAAASNTDGMFGSLDLDLSAALGGARSFTFRVRHFEPSWDWWVALDDVVVDDVVIDAATVPPGERVLLPPETFTGGVLPSGWRVIGPNAGDATWTLTDPCTRSVARTGSTLPYLGGRAVNRMDSSFMLLDSTCGAARVQDDTLATPPFDASRLGRVFLRFASEAWASPAAVAEVVVSIDGGSSWLPQPLFSLAGGGLIAAEDPVFNRHVLEVPAATGQGNVAFGFRYRSAAAAGWWAVDDISVSGVPPAPGEVTGLRVAPALTWDAEPDADRYDVLGGLLSDLLTERSVASASCLADDVALAPWTDARPGPGSGACWYYLVRAQNAGGAGPWGTTSLGVAHVNGACP